MPLATVHLLSLPDTTKYISTLKSSGVDLYVLSKPQRWIIKPEKLSVSALLDTTWDLLIVAPVDQKLPSNGIKEHWSITAGVPSSLTKNFSQKNQKLLHPGPNDTVPRTGETDRPRLAGSSQGLELNKELLDWSQQFELGKGAMSMLNLLAFHPGPEAHASYLRYGKAFAESIGAKRGGTAKIVGKVVKDSARAEDDKEGWDEIALAHYPSIGHFTDMLASEDYQAVNHKDRLPSLRDTCILCTSELDPSLFADAGKAKL